MPTHSEKSVLRLSEHVGLDGVLSEAGAGALVAAVDEARQAASGLRCDDLLAFATSAVREAANSAGVLDHVRAQTGVDLQVLTGQDEARLTFLAVRRWFGWSAGRILVLDIGGGSLELASGIDEIPDVAISLPLGAARLTREHFTRDPADRAEIQALRTHVGERLADASLELLAVGGPDRSVATSKTFRSLARLTGAAPSKEGLRVPRQVGLTGLRQVIGFISRIAASDLAELEGVSPQRSHQLLAGAIVAEAALEALAVSSVEVCPWALREGIILRRLDWLDGV